LGQTNRGIGVLPSLYIDINSKSGWYPEYSQVMTIVISDGGGNLNDSVLAQMSDQDLAGSVASDKEYGGTGIIRSVSVLMKAHGASVDYKKGRGWTIQIHGSSPPG
jgi:hypothetical protein